jgi:hypothetical protein
MKQRRNMRKEERTKEAMEEMEKVGCQKRRKERILGMRK